MPCIYKHCCKKVGRRAASTEAQRTASCRRRPRSPPPPPVQLFSRNPTSFTCSTPMLFLLEPDGASRCLKEHDNYIVELLPDTSAGVQVVSAELNYVASIEHLGGQGKFSRALCSPPPPPPPPPPSPAAAYAASAASNHWVQTSTSRYCKRMMARTACLRSCGKGRWAPMPAELPLASAPPCNRCPGTLDPLSHPPPPPPECSPASSAPGPASLCAAASRRSLASTTSLAAATRPATSVPAPHQPLPAERTAAASGGGLKTPLPTRRGPSPAAAAQQGQQRQRRHPSPTPPCTCCECATSRGVPSLPCINCREERWHERC